MTVVQTNPTFSPAKAGFSLVEMIMLLSLLTVISMPMLLVMDKQQAVLEASEEKATLDIVAQKAFDNVNYNAPSLPYSPYFNVGNPTSIDCDPVRKVNLGVSCDPNRPPFFTRNINLAHNNKVIIVTVGVGNTPAEANLQLASVKNVYRRAYQLDHYRVNIGQPPLSTGIPIKNFAGAIRVDEQGNQWTPEWYASNASQRRMALYTKANNSCYITTSSGVNSGPNPIGNRYPHFNTRRDISTSCAPAASRVRYNFKVVPNATYDVTLHFATTLSIESAGCSNEAHGLSCNVANIGFRSLPNTGTATGLLAFENFDAAADVNQGLTGETGRNNGLGSRKTFTLEMLDDTDRLQIVVSPTINPGGLAGAGAPEPVWLALK